MDIFFSDLDNTLIYSHNRKMLCEKTAVEYLNGREQSYMTCMTYNFLRNAEWLNLVPVTARTEEQYRRINCADELNIKYAVICNGGKLLVNGNEDEKWTAETLELVSEQLGEFEKAVDFFGKICGKSKIHKPEPYMAYAVSENAGELCRKLRKRIESENVRVENDRRKVYIFTAAVNKGNAVKRFKKIVNAGKTVAAGDDIMDIPMLNGVSVALASNRIFDKINVTEKQQLCGEIISDLICGSLEDMHNSGILK